MTSNSMNSDFTAVILAATTGSRLYPLTIDGVDDMDEDYFDDGNDNNNNDLSSSNDKDSKHGNDIATYLPKHLLPLAGRPIINHLIDKLANADLNDIVIVIAAEDDVTISNLMDMKGAQLLQNTINNKNDNDKECFIQFVRFENNNNKQNTCLKIVKLQSECKGSADALRFIMSSSMKQPQSSQQLKDDHDHKNSNHDNDTKNNAITQDELSIIPPNNHVIVLPGDLILYGDLHTDNHDALRSLVNEHRLNYQLAARGDGLPLALTLVLADVGETDENGAPLKESAKAKKGGVSREEGDIEYIALSEISSSSTTFSSKPYDSNVTKRIVMKQSKFQIEEDEDNTGKTPKIKIPKARLHSPIHQMLFSTDWNDIHLICFSPWALNMLQTKLHLRDLSKEVVPFLIESQFKGVKASLGITNDNLKSHDQNISDNSDKEDAKKIKVLGTIIQDVSFQKHFKDESTNINNSRRSLMSEKKLHAIALDKIDYPFTVLAQTLSHRSSKLTLRSCNLQSYSYACREVVSQAIKAGLTLLINPSITESAIDTKFSSVLLTSLRGENVQIKSSTIGRNVKVGNRCRLNNVIVMDDVIIGENCILQNSVLSKGCKLGDNCNLNDCQVGTLHSLHQGTKGKGESYHY